jgi:large subunit ribosomal protein L7Ae
LGKLVNQKTAAVVCITETRKEDQSELDMIAKNCLSSYNDNLELRRQWGGGKLGIKSQHKQEKAKQAQEEEFTKRANL